MAAKYDMQCPQCGHEEREVQLPFGEVPEIRCTVCPNEPMMKQTFKHRSEVVINFGFREHMYNNQTDSDIAKYQFTHL